MDSKSDILIGPVPPPLLACPQPFFYKTKCVCDRGVPGQRYFHYAWAQNLRGWVSGNNGRHLVSHGIQTPLFFYIQPRHLSLLALNVVTQMALHCRYMKPLSILCLTQRVPWCIWMGREGPGHIVYLLTRACLVAEIWNILIHTVSISGSNPIALKVVCTFWKVCIHQLKKVDTGIIDLKLFRFCF